ncbi:helix-turn-helix domain-containing protein [Paraburkholderia sp. A1RO-5L]|uniref:helix-turn-helix domain-containing protein n=1 Tax=unclassified Paraburkholderia TaxID=2615204 RepID=UPI003B97DC02
MNVHARSIRYFDMICRCGSIREAARRLHVDGSAVNRQLLNLEEKWDGGGVKYSLFEQNVAIAEWFRSTWQSIEAGHDA